MDTRTAASTTTRKLHTRLDDSYTQGNTPMFALRLTLEERAKVQREAARQNTNLSEVLRGLIRTLPDELDER